LGYLEQRRERSATPNVLRFLGRVRPGGTLLRQYCLGTLAGDSEPHDASTENAYAVAAELLGAHFARDTEVLEFVSEQLLADGDGRPVVREAPLIALCEGWPESEELQRALRVLQENQQGLSYAAYFQLASLFYDGEQLLEDIRNMLLSGAELKDSRRNTPGRLNRPLSRPVKRRVIVLRRVLEDFLERSGPTLDEDYPVFRDSKQPVFAQAVLEVLCQVAGERRRRFVPIMPDGNCRTTRAPLSCVRRVALPSTHPDPRLGRGFRVPK